MPEIIVPTEDPAPDPAATEIAQQAAAVAVEADAAAADAQQTAQAAADQATLTREYLDQTVDRMLSEVDARLRPLHDAVARIGRELDDVEHDQDAADERSAEQSDEDQDHGDDEDQGETLPPPPAKDAAPAQGADQGGRGDAPKKKPAAHGMSRRWFGE